jgi:glycosyltransferase involved in cell wall biosynthesis
MPFFSIIIPTLNSAKTLSMVMESILQQSFADFEILIIDGLSTDMTLKIAQSYCNERIKITSEKDYGIYDAMNKGIQLAKGKWVYFIGSDDRFCNSDVLWGIYKVIESNKYDIIYGNVISSRFQGRYDFDFDQEKILNKNICQQAIFFKRDIFDKVGFFNLRYKSHSDWDHNMKWILNPNIKNAYFEIDIAEYADGGFSSINGDKIFEQERIYNYLKYGIWIFSFKKSKNIIYKLVIKSLKQWHIKRIIQLGFFFIIALHHKLLPK